MFAEGPIQPIQDGLLVVETESTFTDDDSLTSEIAGCGTQFF
jgi:hypothetical protein